MTLSARHHLIVRADVLKPPTDPRLAKEWLQDLIRSIGMVLADVPGNPIAYYCPVPGNRGLTATALIETSNITLHTWDERSPAEIQLDVFTCGGLDVIAVLQFVKEFMPTGVKYLLLNRDNDISVCDFCEYP